jgi:hypothetical protein
MKGALGLPAWLWAAAFCAGSGLYATLLARLRTREDRNPRWWIGYARDGTNLVGAGLYLAAIWLAGFRGPPMLVIGVGLLLASYGLDWLLGKHWSWRRAPLWVVGSSTALALLCALGGARLEAAVAAMVAVAQPR